LSINSQEIRATLADLEASARDANARVVAAEHQHALAMRSAIDQGTPEALASLSPYEEELAASRAASDRIYAAVAACRTMLDEALQAEREAAQQLARQDIERQLAEAQEAAAEVDSLFSDLCACLLALREREITARKAVRDAFGNSPSGAPRALSACDYMASHLRTLANGLRPEPQGWTAEALRGAARVTREALVQ